MTLPVEVSEVLEGKRRWCVLQADNREVLPLLPDKAVGATLTDPPYDERTHKGARTTARESGEAVDLGIDFPWLTDYGFVRDLLHASARWVLAFCAMRQFSEYERAAGESWVRDGIWRRTDSTPQFTGDRPAQGCEGVAIMHRAGRKRWNGGGFPAFWECCIERNDRAHPTQKPIALMLELVELFTDPDEVVLDPFAGSGTTGVACLRLGRRFIGIEKDEKYAAIARERLSAESQGLSLRDARAGQLPLLGGAL